MPNILGSFAILLASLLFFFSPSSISAPSPLIVTGSSTWEPFSFINQEGKPDGIMVDFWKLYAQKNNIKIDFHLLPWAESLRYARDIPNALHGGLGYTSDRAKYLAFSNELPLRPYHVYLFVQKTFPFQNLNRIGNAVVGTVKESTKHAFLSSRIPENNILQFPTFGSLNDAAYRGEVNIFIDDLSTALYDMKRSGNNDLFTPRRKLYSFPLHFSVGKAFQENIANIERGLDEISIQEIQLIYNKWFPQNNLPPLLNWLNKEAHTWVPFCSVLLFILSLISFRKRLKFRTRELKCAVKALNDSKENFKSAKKIDALTGAKTRHYFFAHLLEKRFSSTPYLVAVLDVDGLKDINTKYGQDIGDMALKHLATQVRLHIPSNTIFARLAGGKFGISFEMHEISQAMQKIDRIQHALKINPLKIDQQVIIVQFQVGISVCPNESESGETLVQIAAARMRAQKNTLNAVDKKETPKEVNYEI